jgi:hypothetical protein
MLANRRTPDPPPVQEAEVEYEKPVVKAPAPPPPPTTTTTPPKPPPIKSVKIAEPTPLNQSPRPGREITITSHLIRMLEEDLPQLHKQIQFNHEEEGWRVMRVQPGSLFSQAGLIEGDLITHKAVDSLRYQERGEEDLPDRLSRILSYVTN